MAEETLVGTSEKKRLQPLGRVLCVASVVRGVECVGGKIPAKHSVGVFEASE